jgi:hypothetical protein
VDSTWASLNQNELLRELDTIERAIARSSAFNRYLDEAGHTQLRISAELLRLAEREHSLVTELRQRRRDPLAA